MKTMNGECDCWGVYPLDAPLGLGTWNLGHTYEEEAIQNLGHAEHAGRKRGSAGEAQERVEAQELFVLYWRGLGRGPPTLHYRCCLF